MRCSKEENFFLAVQDIYYCFFEGGEDRVILSIIYRDQAINFGSDVFFCLFFAIPEWGGLKKIKNRFFRAWGIFFTFCKKSLLVFSWRGYIFYILSEKSTFS